MGAPREAARPPPAMHLALLAGRRRGAGASRPRSRSITITHNNIIRFSGSSHTKIDREAPSRHSAVFPAAQSQPASCGGTPCSEENTCVGSYLRLAATRRHRLLPKYISRARRRGW